MNLPSPSTSSRTAAGIGYGMAAGAIWGLVFLAPALLHGFTPLELTTGRYTAYGALALALLAPRWRVATGALGRREWLGLAGLGLVGNVVYFVLLSSAVQLGGIAITSLVVGFLPVTVTVIGSRDHGAVPLRRLLPSIALCIAGAVCIGWQALLPSGYASGTRALLGLLCATGALAAWTWYAVSNSRWLARLHDISAHDWSLLTGVVTGALALALVPFALLGDTARHASVDWLRFGGISAALALLASITGNALWNRMSRLLPLTLVGQMILFETLFALIYGFAWEHRLPTTLEALAFVLLVTGVVTCVLAHGAAVDPIGAES
ncbi:DMT family transporter [Dyella ginsengisoli]|uniref:DMT family transporter n=1 Tax=Dyella ginsengisoli TaxID=363848 RepID=UPI00034779F3|nr:DMT family transporter [Dyella ginsengisoli]